MDKHESIDGLERMIAEQLRKDALSWWNSMGDEAKYEEWKKWRLVTNDHRKRWQLAMVDMSSSTIEKIYRENVLGEMF